MRHRGSRAGGGGAYAHQIQQQQSQSHQQQLQQVQQIDRTQSLARAREARQVEKSLAEIGTVFGKMSTLLVSQGETITKIEDDIESAHYDVSAGQNEITILYQLKKGNRMLIIKTFALLIFLIIFMRFYAR
jgi:syntaxin 5